MLHSHENTINFASCSFSFFMHTWISLWVCALILIIISQEVKNLRRRFIVTCKREKINVCNIISILHPESLRFLKNISLTHRMLNMIIAFFCVGIFFERVRKFFNSIRQVDKEHNKRWGAIARSDFFCKHLWPNGQLIYPVHFMRTISAKTIIVIVWETKTSSW